MQILLAGACWINVFFDVGYDALDMGYDAQSCGIRCTKVWDTVHTIHRVKLAVGLAQ